MEVHGDHVPARRPPYDRACMGGDRHARRVRAMPPIGARSSCPLVSVAAKTGVEATKHPRVSRTPRARAGRTPRMTGSIWHSTP